MGGRVLAVVAEVFVGLVLAGIVVGGVIPFAHGTIGPGGAALIGLATIVLVIVAGEAFRRRPSRP
jgi:predicted lipid-binding transport protein (Tim44 family)